MTLKSYVQQYQTSLVLAPALYISIAAHLTNYFVKNFVKNLGLFCRFNKKKFISCYTSAAVKIEQTSAIILLTLSAEIVFFVCTLSYLQLVVKAVQLRDVKQGFPG